MFFLDGIKKNLGTKNIMSSSSINSIIIVGGGSAGWMTASTIVKFFPDKQITLIESKDIGRIGVGESTLPTLMAWLSALEIDYKDFMKYTDASYKLSITFKNFHDIDDKEFHYPFGTPYLDNCIFPGANDWHISKILNLEYNIPTYTESLYPQMQIIKNNKISNEIVDGFDLNKHSALHFDAMKFADWLMNKYAVPRGVRHIEANIDKVLSDSDGISGLVLENGNIVSADLYIDCSGFKSILLGKELKEPFIDYSDRLPVNRAWGVQIPYNNKISEIKPYTECIALSSGWVWNAPLYSRIGTGYVYSDKFISPEDALEEFKEYLIKNKGKDRINDSLKFNDIKFKTGIYNRTWVKNVVAIGLSASFIEPLESNGLFFIHENLLKVVQVLSRDTLSKFDISSYNLITKNSYDSFANFIRMHYFLTKREDSEFWRFMKALDFNESILTPENEIFETTLNIHSKQALDVSGLNGYHAIIVGNMVSPISNAYIQLLKHYTGIDPKDISLQFLEKTHKSIEYWKNRFFLAENHYEYLRRNFHMEEIND